MKYLPLLLAALLLSFSQCSLAQSGSKKPAQPNPYYSHTDTKKVSISNDEWKKILAPNVFYIARQEGTERAFTGPWWDNHKAGTYYCAACGYKLFLSSTKFESGTGWPSFYQPVKGGVTLKKDKDGFRDEVECARCSSHLGHVFDDGPAPTGLRYCMNGTVLDFIAGN